MIKKYSTYLAAAFVAVASACSDDLDVIIPEPDNITFNEIQMPDRFTHVITDGGFSVSGVNFNAVKSGSQLAGGFCVSNRSYRQFAAAGDEVSVDSMRYSVWTPRPNTTGNYLVGHANGDDAYFTLDRPSVIEYTLVANTTWNFLAMYYGDTYSGKDGEPVANINVPSKPMGIWHTYVPGGVNKFGDNDYLTLTAADSLSAPCRSTLHARRAIMLKIPPGITFSTTGADLTSMLLARSTKWCFISTRPTKTPRATCALPPTSALTVSS